MRLLLYHLLDSFLDMYTRSRVLNITQIAAQLHSAVGLRCAIGHLFPVLTTSKELQSRLNVCSLARVQKLIQAIIYNVIFASKQLKGIKPIGVLKSISWLAG